MVKVLDKLALELITDREHPADKGTSVNEKIERLIDMAFASRADEEEWLRRWDIRLTVLMQSIDDHLPSSKKLSYSALCQPCQYCIMKLKVR